MAYATKLQFAIRHDYADWASYAAANPNVPTETHVDELLEEATEIINEKIGSYNSDVTDSRFASRLEKLCLRMVDRMREVDKKQGMQEGFLQWSTTDFLQERERNYLYSIGQILTHRTPGGASSG